MCRPLIARSLLGASLLACLCLALMELSSAPAGAAKGPAGRPQVRILSPTEDSHPRRAALVARVRVHGGHFRAYLNGENVTRRFEGAALRSARFRRGADFEPGRGSLFVIVGKGPRSVSDQVYFTAEARHDGVLRLRRVGEGSYPAPRFHARTEGRLRKTKVWVNGKRVDRWFGEDDDLRGLAGQLGGSAGLRYGRNRVTVEAQQLDGRFGRRTIEFRVPRTRTIASAGSDRRVSAGSAARLDARASRGRAAGKGGAAASAALQYEWDLIGAPPGSQAQISGLSSPLATLVPDVAGTYRALVTVTGEGLAKSVDEAVIEAPQTISPMGIPIQTITDEGAIQIGAPGQRGAATYPKRGNWVQMLVLDPGTAAPIGGAWDEHSGVPEERAGVLAFNPGEGEKLLAAVEATEFQQLVLLSGQGNTVNMDSSDAAKLQKAIEFLGGTVASWGPSPNGPYDLATKGPWSLIGHDGLTPGQAMQNTFVTEQGIPGFLGGSTGLSGSLNGYLQSGINATGFQYVSPEVAAIDTKWTPSLSEPPSANQNTILVGEKRYTSQPLSSDGVADCPCSVGIQLLVLDPSDLSVVHEGTYGVLTTNGSTAYHSIYALDQALHEYVSGNAPGAQQLIILQDFGTQGCACWPSNSSDWLQDTLPSSEYTPSWAGGRYPNGVTELFKSWNEANVHGFGTVAGNLGMLAGVPVHDVVANYRRPVYVASRHATVPRTWGGLTVISNTHLYQWSSAFAQGQGDLPPSGSNPLVSNGRVTGVLRRNEQSQWEMTTAALGAGYPGLVEGVEPNSPVNSFDAAAMPELVMRPQAPWPCSEEQPAPCSESAAEVRAAMAYVASELPDLGGVDDVRDDYLSDSIEWSNLHSDVKENGTIQCKGHSDFGEATCEALRNELAQEFEDLGQVKNGFKELTSLLSTDATDAQFDIKQATKEVVKAMTQAFEDIPKEKAGLEISGPLEKALFVTSGLLDAATAGGLTPGLSFAPGALSAAAYLVGYGHYIFPFFHQGGSTSESKVPNNTNLVTDEVENFAADMQLQLTATEETLKHFLDIIRTDPVKLHQAAVNFGKKWELNSDNEEKLGRAITIGAEQSLYNTLMPIAYEQWVLGPRFTALNPEGAHDLPDQTYHCRRLNGEGYIEENFDQPLEFEPASMSAMTSVDYSNERFPGGNHASFTVRFLKSREDPPQIEGAQHEENVEEEGDNFLQHKGVGAPAWLTDPLFEAPSELESPLYPRRLGMSKDEFFGLPSWTMRKLQCGIAR